MSETHHDGDGQGFTRRLLREPLLHFFVAGGLIFALQAYVSDGEPAANARLIEVDNATREFTRARFKRTWQREPTAAELQSAMEEWVREEILYREGMALGLAEGDPLTRRRLGQRVMMLAEAAAPPPADEATLKSWFEERAEEYRRPSIYSLRQVFFSADAGNASKRAREALAAINNGGVVAQGDATLQPRTLEAVPDSYLENSFGSIFSKALEALPVGSWQGPVTSAFGEHLVYLSDRSGGDIPAFADVRSVIERDWQYEQNQKTKERFYDELRAAYTVQGLDNEATP